MKHRHFLLFVFFAATVLAGVFAVSSSSLTAQTISVDEQFACKPTPDSVSGEFTGIFRPSDPSKRTDPLDTNRTFVLTCYNKQNPADTALQGNSNSVTATVMK